MWRFGVMIFVAIVIAMQSMYAQQMSTKYYEENPQDDGLFAGLPEGYELFFLYPLSIDEMKFERNTRFSTSSVDYSWRGIDRRKERFFVNGVDISPVFDEYTDSGLLFALRRYQPTSAYYYSSATSSFVTVTDDIVETYSVRPIDIRELYSVRLQYADRTGRAAATMTGMKQLDPFWRIAFSASFRGGRDRFVKGAFSETYHAAIGVERTLVAGNRLSLFVVAAPSMYSSRSWAMQEVFDLTGDNLYNPSWGMQDGRERSSKIRRNFTPMAMLTYDFTLSDKTHMSASAMYLTGEKSRSGLTWFDAATPLPDTYAYLPSYQTDDVMKQSLAEVWQRGDERYTQVDWTELYYQNMTSSSGMATYISDNRVERMNNFQFLLNGVTKADNGFQSSYGLRYRNDDSRYFKRATDMLGAEWALDVDQYLIDDVEYGDKYHNDMNNPDRVIRKGDEFGYNYSMRRSGLTLFGVVNYIHNRFRMDVSGETTFSSLYRNGHYRKESLPALSFGPSERLNLSSYALKAAARFAHTPNSHIALSAFATEREPLYDDIFLSPEASNKIVDDVRNEFSYGGDLRLRHAFYFISMDLTAYWYKTTGRGEIIRYYDDAYAQYCDMALSNMSHRNSGVEAAFDVDVTNLLSLSAAIAYNSYEYTNNPQVDIYRDVDGEELFVNGVSHMKGYVSNTSPQMLVSLGVSYDFDRNTFIRANYTYFDRRYISLSPLRRTDRMLAHAPSIEAAKEWYEQERLPSAGVVDVFFYRRFGLKSGDRLSFSVSVKNLLNRKDVVYGGYEQMRFKKMSSGNKTVYRPYGSKYAYAYPRNCYVTVTYQF